MDRRVRPNSMKWQSSVKPKSLPTSIRLEPALKATLVEQAKTQACSLTWLIADILQQWVKWKKGQKE